MLCQNEVEAWRRKPSRFLRLRFTKNDNKSASTLVPHKKVGERNTLERSGGWRRSFAFLDYDNDSLPGIKI